MCLPPPPTSPIQNLSFVIDSPEFLHHLSKFLTGFQRPDAWILVQRACDPNLIFPLLLLDPAFRKPPSFVSSNIRNVFSRGPDASTTIRYVSPFFPLGDTGVPAPCEIAL